VRTRDEIQADIRALEARKRESIEELLHREYFPARKKLQEECATLGHHRRTTEFNLMRTRQWDVCGYCGAGFNEIRLED
jgi:hypothetical protein